MLTPHEKVGINVEDDVAAMYVEPENPPEAVDDAGRILIAPIEDEAGKTYWDAYFSALDIVDNWRVAHNFPLTVLRTTLGNRAKRIDQTCLVAQRIKRLISIEHKLRRMPKVPLSEMQDIGGCRAVMRSVMGAAKLANIYRDGYRDHELERENDYIKQPKSSGYRSIHLIFRYHSDKRTAHNGLRIELQIRSTVQHIFATTVETVERFTQQALKYRKGDKRWDRFFRLMGSAIALRENTPPVLGTPTIMSDIAKELREYIRDLEVERTLAAYQSVLQNIEHASLKNAHYFLLKLELSKGRLNITGFRPEEQRRASEMYLQLERQMSRAAGDDVLLVSADSLSSLKRAYPNYFADTTAFIAEMRKSLV